MPREAMIGRGMVLSISGVNAEERRDIIVKANNLGFRCHTEV